LSPSSERHADNVAGVWRSFGGLAAGSLVGQLIGFIALAYVARKVGPSNIGAYTFALTLSTYAGLVADAGIAYKSMRDVSRDPALLRAAVRETVLLQASLALVIYALLVTVAPLVTPDPTARRMIPVVGLLPLVSGVTIDWALLAIGRAKDVAVWRLVGQVVYAIPVPLLVVGGATGALRYAGLNVLGVAVTACGLLYVYKRRAPTAAGSRTSPRTLFVRLRSSVPFAYVLVMTQIYAGMGPLLLGYLDTTRAVGTYAIAAKLPSALVMLSQAWLSAFFPYTARQLRSNPAQLLQDLGGIISAAVVLVIALSTGAALCAQQLIPALFGTAFSSAATPFILLTVEAGLAALQVSLTNSVLLGLDSQRYYMTLLTVAVSGVFLLSVLLIPLLGPTGAAAANVTGEVFITIAAAVGVTRRVGEIPLRYAAMGRGVVAVGAMAGAMIAVGTEAGVIPQILVGVAVFFAAAWATGAIRGLRTGADTAVSAVD
jgi:O-antigen/teichoic acid export membrane protein